MSATTTLILGGGFGGLATANTLRALLPGEHEIVMIDPTERFFVGAGKTWVMLGERTFAQISQSRRSLLAKGVTWVQASVRSIGLDDRTIATDSHTMKWDHLVIALGADCDLGLLPGLQEAAHTFYTIDGAHKLRSALDEFAGGEVVLLIPRAPFKCPPAPYEAAMLLHHQFGRRGLSGKASIAVHTVEGAPMTTAGPEMGAYIKGELAKRSIGFFGGRRAARVEPADRRIVFEDGAEVRYDLLIAVPPHVAPTVVRDAGLTGNAGWIQVDPRTLHLANADGPRNVYAIGDVTVVPLPGRYRPDMPLSLPKAGVFAEAQGRVVAHQIAANVSGRAAQETFDGRGYCFLETGGGRAVRAEGSFFETPQPVMRAAEASESQLRDKVAWLEGLLEPR